MVVERTGSPSDAPSHESLVRFALKEGFVLNLDENSSLQNPAAIELPIEFPDTISLQPLEAGKGFTTIVERILHGVDDGLDSYGKNVKDIFYMQMEAMESLKRSEIVDNPEKFEECLSRFFTAGTPIVDRSIGRAILQEFDIPVCAGLNFRTAVEIVKRHPHREVSIT